MKYVKQFESFREEYPDMFEPLKEEDMPQSVPGFEDGTIDPDDDEVYVDEHGKPLFSEKSEKEQYEDFKKITTERNIKEYPDRIEINLKKLYHDFYMSIYNSTKHYKKFVNNLLLGSYISKGAYNIMSDDYDNIEGIITEIVYYISDYAPILNLKIKDVNIKMDNIFTHSIVTIDKIKSSASKYNL